VTAVPDSPELLAPPHDAAAERAVLGAMLLAGSAVEEVVGIIRADDHYQPAHKTIHEAMIALHDSGQPVDAVAVMSELNRTGMLTRVGGAPYLHTLMQAVPTAANAGYYAGLVKEAATLRRLVQAGTRIAQLGYGAAAGNASVAEAVDRAQAEVEAVLDQNLSGSGPVGMTELIGPAIEEVERLSSGEGSSLVLPTGLNDLDAIFGGGLRRKSVTIVAGRPATGKSLLAAQILRYTSTALKVPTLLFSLEMDRMEITMRHLSAHARINLADMRTGQLPDDQWMRLASRAGDLMDSPMFIADASSLTPSQALATCRRWKQRHGIQQVAVDYLQLESTGKRVESRQVEVSELSRSWKLIAMELDLSVIVVAQLNRGPEQRTDKKPMLSDLRESGSLEQDADNVVLLHRPDVYDPDDRPGEADLIVAKQRGGPTGVATVLMQGHYSRFVDLAGWAA
jgi:replicative DNA helicase